MLRNYLSLFESYFITRLSIIRYYVHYHMLARLGTASCHWFIITVLSSLSLPIILILFLTWKACTIFLPGSGVVILSSVLPGPLRFQISTCTVVYFEFSRISHPPSLVYCITFWHCLCVVDAMLCEPLIIVFIFYEVFVCELFSHLSCLYYSVIKIFGFIIKPF